MAKASKKILSVGEKINGFSLPGTGGEVSASSFKGRFAVIYFYPKDATPGCTLEGHDFSKLLPKFKKLQCEVYGVSRDSLASHEKFRAKEGYKVDLLSDVDEAACSMFGVMKMKNMYGKKVRGVERSTFVISRDGVVLKEWRGVKVPGHAEEVLEYIKSLE